MTVNDLYKIIEQNGSNKEMFSLAQDKETEGLFQMESNLFKMLCEDIIPTNENDICAILSIGRPGPLSAGMHTQYAQRKNGFEIAVPQLRDTDHITKDTYHTIIYQEQCMLIAKHVAGFDDSQTDSLCRKPLAKKKKDLMEIFRKCFIFGKKNCNPPEGYNADNINQPFYDHKSKYGPEILGGLNNGYELIELEKFYDSLKGYCSYLFNKSHSASYAVITLCTMYLKKFHKAKFFAALLSMQETEEKINLYSKICKDYNINIKAPDINLSDYDFTEKDGEILYGLKSIKGAGEASIKEIIENRPYVNLQDAKDRLTTKAFNKRVGMGLLKAGAFDYLNSNRYELINEFYAMRKDKDELLDINSYCPEVCMQLEREILGTCITYTPWWDEVLEKSQFTQQFILENVSFKNDKNGKTMAFATLNYQGVPIKAIAFASIYNKNRQAFNKGINTEINITGEKDNRGQIVIKKVLPLNNTKSIYTIE